MYFSSTCWQSYERIETILLLPSCVLMSFSKGCYSILQNCTVATRTEFDVVFLQGVLAIMNKFGLSPDEHTFNRIAKVSQNQTQDSTLINSIAVCFILLSHILVFIPRFLNIFIQPSIAYFTIPS